ncbi:hypothetical protein B296_00012986 [Ensete ventricosum]|uniref:Uncharacterized protein n=1 Tax=Ensete ventricosum TaxID=4639 RepID=A0A427B846_ENSVE|nr:hypothetical protein B296_00012986 [Ensete ventricosum]
MSVAVRLSGLQEEMVGAGDAAWQREVEEAEGRVAAGRLSRRVGEAEMAAVGSRCCYWQLGEGSLLAMIKSMLVVGDHC